MSGTSSVRLARAYDEPRPDDGWRVLVDRVWPRGRPREALRIDEWARDLAPSDDLRRWFAHEPARWDGFRERYRRELAAPERTRLLEALAARLSDGPVTLVYGARDRDRNQAQVIAEVLRGRFDR